MSERLKFKRFFLFHGWINSGDHPNTLPLIEKFEINTRTIRPLHLMHSMDNRHFPALCMHRQEIRDFALVQISEIHFAEETTHLPEDLPSIKDSMGVEVRISVAPCAGAWIETRRMYKHTIID